MAEILVINPNSSVSVTQSMQACLGPVENSTKHVITCIGLAEGPPGIETDEHVAQVVPHLLETVRRREANAYVLGCFSDPGIREVRRATSNPVVGIAEAAYLAALALGDRFGIVSLGPSSVARHRRYLDDLGLAGRLAGDRSIDMTVTESMAGDIVEAVTGIGRTLRDADGADVVILGCAGLGSYRETMEARLGLPIVDPVQAGVLLACNRLDLRYHMRAA